MAGQAHSGLSAGSRAGFFADGLSRGGAPNRRRRTGLGRAVSGTGEEEMYRPLIAMLLGTIMGLTGCATVEGLGQDVETTGRAIQKTVRDARS